MVISRGREALVACTLTCACDITQVLTCATQIPLKPDEARSSRDALAKAIYGKLFGWVVQQVTSK